MAYRGCGWLTTQEIDDALELENGLSPAESDGEDKALSRTPAFEELDPAEMDCPPPGRGACRVYRRRNRRFGGVRR